MIKTEQQATIAVAVTVKLTARGSTPEELISNAAYDADRIVESALRTSENTQSMTVEGATALVNVREIETPKVEVYLSMDQYPLSFPADEQITVFDEVPETVHTDVSDLESGMRIVLDRQVCTISQVHDAPEGTMVLCEGERFPICLAVPTVPVVV